MCTEPSFLRTQGFEDSKDDVRMQQSYDLFLCAKRQARLGLLKSRSKRGLRESMNLESHAQDQAPPVERHKKTRNKTSDL